MKSKSKLALMLTCMLMLSACQSSDTQQGAAIATINGENISATQLYDELINSSTGRSAFFQEMIREVVTTNFPITDAMKTEADITIENLQDQYTSYYGSDGETYLTNALTQSGFEDLDDYRQTLLYSFQLQEFLNQYIQDHFDEVFQDYYDTQHPRYVSHILISMDDPDNPTEEEQAKLDEVQSRLDAGEDFATLAKEYSDDTTASVGGNLGICDSSTSFVTEFLDAAMALEEGQISGQVKTDYGVHFIKVDSTDAETMKTDYHVLEERLPSYDTYMIYLAMQDYNVTITDETLKQIYDDQLQSYLDQRAANRGEDA